MLLQGQLQAYCSVKKVFMMVKSKNNVLCNASELTHICGIGAHGNVSFLR